MNKNKRNNYLVFLVLLVQSVLVSISLYIFRDSVHHYGLSLLISVPVTIVAFFLMGKIDKK